MKLRIRLITLLLAAAGLAALADQQPQPRRPQDTLTGGGKGVGAWTIHVSQTPGAPLLAVRHARQSEVEISWPDSPVNYQLLLTTNAFQPQWTKVVEPIQTAGTNKFILTQPVAGVCYYRLEKMP